MLPLGESLPTLRVPNPRTGLSDSHRLWNQDSMELMRTNTTKERLAKGEVVYGCGLQVYRAPEIPRAFAAAGFDYVFIDMEHGSLNLETAHDMITACKLASITPIVRVCSIRCAPACWIRARRASSCRAWKIPRCSKKRSVGCAFRR